MEAILDIFMSLLKGKLSAELIVFVVSLFPVLELRGGILAGYALGLELLPAFIWAYIGNILPVPFILFLMKTVFNFLKRTILKKYILKLEERTMRKSDTIQKYGYWGLFIFVAIPLPGTGAWTGTMAATLLELDIKKSFIAIALGVFTAGIIMSIFSFGLLSAIGIG